MTQGPGGPPLFGPPPQQPQPGPFGPPQAPPSSPSPSAGDGPTGTARLLALAAAGIAVVIYLLGFFGDGSIVLAGVTIPLLLGGGLLTGAAALPKAGRVLLPGAVAAVTGTLMLLQLVTEGGAPGVVLFALILAIIESAAAVGAFLMDAGLVSAPSGGPGSGRARGPQPPPGYGPPQGYPPPGYGGPPGYGPPPSPAMPPAQGGYGQPPPPPQSGWGQGPPPPLGGQPDTGARPLSTGPDADRTEPRDDMSATTAIPIVSGATAGGRPAEETPYSDETNFFDDGSMFGKTTTSRPAQEPAPAETRSPTAAMPPVDRGADRVGDRGTDRGVDRSAAPTDDTSAFGDGSAKFTEPGPRGPEPKAEGRHEQPADGDRNGVPPHEQTWFMPPGDRPSN